MHARARVALLIQHATRMRHTVSSFVTSLAPPYVSTLSHKRHDFREKSLNVKRVFLFFIQFLPIRFLILRRISRDFAINMKTSSCKVLILIGF